MKQKLLDRVRRIEPGKALLVAMLLVFFIFLLSFINYYSLDSVIVLGNVHYTEDEIRSEVTKGLFGNNTWIVSRLKDSFVPENMELIDQIDVTMKDHHTLQITVQERQLIGYVQYLDCNLYFDSEGRVMDSVVSDTSESTDTAGEGTEALTAEAVGKTATSFVTAMKEAPRINGLDFTSAQLHEILPVKDASVFYTILGIARMVNKYDINPDAVNFDETMQITLTYKDVTVNLGKDELIEEKLARVAAILPSIEGKNGVLHMEDYTSGTQNIVFSQNVLAAEDVDEDETDTAADGSTQTKDTTAESDTSTDGAAESAAGDGTGSVSSDTAVSDKNTGKTTDHSLALVTVKKQQTSAAQTEQTQTGNTTGNQSTAGAVTSGSESQTTQQGTTQQNTTQQGTTQQGTTQQNTTQQGTTQQDAAGQLTDGTAGSDNVQIDKPVLGNLQ